MCCHGYWIQSKLTPKVKVNHIILLLYFTELTNLSGLHFEWNIKLTLKHKHTVIIPDETIS